VLSLAFRQKQVTVALRRTQNPDEPMGSPNMSLHHSGVSEIRHSTAQQTSVYLAVRDDGADAAMARFEALRNQAEGERGRHAEKFASNLPVTTRNLVGMPGFEPGTP
jgi:hypothetical protein